MVLKKIGGVGLALFLSLAGYGQQSEGVQHRELKEVRVVASRGDFYKEDVHVTRIDSGVMAQNAHLNLGQLLSVSTAVMVKSYGSSGALSNISLRGSGSNHTSVTWNGFPLNSLTLGSQDLSGVDAGLMQGISLAHGASGTLYGSGTFGGSIDMSNKPQWNSPSSVIINTQLGSFNSQRYGTHIRVGNSKLRYLLNAFYQKSDGDFPYYDPFLLQPRQNRKHNELKNRGVMQNLFLKLPNTQRLEMGLWIQSKDKNLPLIMGSMKDPKENQMDESFRGYLKYSKRYSQSELVVKGAGFNDFQRYNDGVSLWKYKTKRFYGDLNYRYYLSTSWVFDVGGLYQYSEADVTAYGGNINESRAALIGALKYIRKGWVVNASVRGEYNSQKAPKPLFSLGLRYDILPGIMSFRSNVSTKYRIPTFNEKHWQPGGNPNLSPEKGWSAEAGLQGIFSGKRVKGSWNVTAYCSRINNYIQWLPKGNYYEAVATDRVWARGVEAQFGVVKKMGQWTLKSNGAYTYTRSTYDTEGFLKDRQLIYVPQHQGKIDVNLTYKGAWLGYYHHYNGENYFSNNENRTLDAYWLGTVVLGKEFNLLCVSTQLQARIENIWDQDYQVVRSYPMPGRAYYISFRFILK